MSNQLMQMLSNPGFLLQVAMGKVPGATFVYKFGEVASIASGTPADIWEFGVTSGAETYTFSADGVADIDTISSSDNSDTQTMLIDGLDINGTHVVQEKALTGQTKAVLDTPLWRVNRVYNTNSVSLAGDFYCYVDTAISAGVPTLKTTVRGYVAAGRNQTLQAIYTTPLGFSAFFMGLVPSLGKGSGATAVGANFTGTTREYGKVPRIQDSFSLISSGTSARDITFPIPLPFNERTDFIPNVSTTSAVGFTLGYTILLLEKSKWGL